MTNTQTSSNIDSSTETIEPAAMVAGYFECWNAPDEDARSAAIVRTWAEDATSTDPLSQVKGHESIAAMMAAVFENYPGHAFRQVGDVDHHNNAVRWGWEMLDAGGSQMLEGIDAARVDESGRIAELMGFFGSAVPGTEAS